MVHVVKTICCFAICMMLLQVPANAQNPRVSDPNQIGWFATNATVRFAEQWSSTLELQWRRDDWLRNGMQNLVRGSINYQVHPSVSLRAGYAFAETFPYGDPTIQAAGKTFPEHRTFQQAFITQPLNRLALQHRFMLEQRWIGRFTDPTNNRAHDYQYVNRFRYLARLQAPLQKPAANGAHWYAAVWDELMVNFGKEVTQNVFDQNRSSLIVGRQFSPHARVEGGFLSQIVQLGRQLTPGRPIFQYNTGFTVSAIFNIDARKKDVGE
ncbi:DUF2490 domain-containing protein [Pseudocnuella soli]|uniref:DUF2490 domain-containing protein n=1 Tax=Pseudocnuella soli TaxID=2502779 RepID=UPI0019598732|nr:DUF2490 domain-containing protein [Pseudocnuella soli]